MDGVKDENNGNNIPEIHYLGSKRRVPELPPQRNITYYRATSVFFFYSHSLFDVPGQKKVCTMNTEEGAEEIDMEDLHPKQIPSIPDDETIIQVVGTHDSTSLKVKQ